MNERTTIDDFWKEEILHFLKGELNAESEKTLLHWINSNKEHQEIFESYRNLYLNSVVNAKPQNNVNTDELWQQLMASTKPTASKKVKQIIFYISRIAAVFIVLFALGIIIYWKFEKNTYNDTVCQIVTPLGSKSQITLPDGTIVWMNAGTKLSYSKSYGKTDRRVFVEGEIFCKVVSNKEKPFIVQTSLINVIAVGTTFNVKAYPEDKTVSTTLVEGIVKIENAKTNKNKFLYTLRPKQNIVFTKTFSTPKIEAKSPEEIKSDTISGLSNIKKVELDDSVNTILYTSWMEQNWVIEGLDLFELSKLLERKYDIKIIFNSEELKNFRFSGTVRNETLEQVLQILSLTTPLDYEIGKGEVLWNIDPKQANRYKNVLRKR
jgi:ferric-dicitrate binding protein FerR (iron transport regulator)